MNVVEMIVQALQRLGVTKAGIAAALGNAQIESSDNPSALNGAEGAIGLFQWEGGRRSGLQAYARSHGLSESDPRAQVGFLVQELEGPYSNVLAQLRQVQDPRQAAAIFDAQYEISSGSSRQQREDAAAQYFQSGNIPLSSADSGRGDMSGATPGIPSMPNPTASDYTEALGSLGGLLTRIPELKKILQEAVSGGWAVTKFQQAIEGTAWYRTHNDNARQFLALQASDPATFQREWQNAYNHVSEMAQQLGVAGGGSLLRNLTNQYMVAGWDDATLQRELAAHYNTKGTPAGQAAQIYDQLRQTYSQYGVPYNNATLQYRTQQVLAGATTADTYKNQAMAIAKSMYPGLSSQIDQGLTVKDAADPYVQTMANLLEVNPNTINWANDSLIKKALQGTALSVNDGAKGAGASGTLSNYTTMPLWQFEQQLRADPRWQYTNNAMDATSTALMTLGRDLGKVA